MLLLPIKIPDSLPARAVLESENIFVMTEHRATTQRIRPLRIAILNLMPLKIVTETQILRCLSNTPIQIEVDLIQTKTYHSKNTPEDHLLTFYKTFDDIRDQKYDGFIITGAPIELMPFEEVEYWDELVEIMEWTKTHVHSTLHICWGAQAALHYHYGLQKVQLPQKMFGVFPHTLVDKSVPLLRGFDEIYWMPHSRHTEIPAADIRATGKLYILSSSPIAGVNIVSNHNGRQIFIFGHSEYEANTLAIEASLHDLGYQRTQAENSLCSLLGEVPHTIARGRLENQQLPDDLTVGVPLLMLSNRPDVRSAEYSLMQSYYATASARSALYPSITLSGTVGWTNNSGAGIVNPGKLIWNAAGSLLQPIFNANANRARVKIAKAQQEESKLSFQQTLLNAGAEVNNALTQCQSARAKADLRVRQIEALERAVESTELLMQHGSTTYLEVLTAQQSLLSAQLSQIADRFDEIQGTVNLYQALGGGRDITEEK